MSYELELEILKSNLSDISKIKLIQVLAKNNIINYNNENKDYNDLLKLKNAFIENNIDNNLKKQINNL